MLFYFIYFNFLFKILLLRVTEEQLFNNIFIKKVGKHNSRSHSDIVKYFF